MCKIMNISWTSFLSIGSLFRQVNGSDWCFQILCVSFHLNVYNPTSQVHPYSTQKFVWTKHLMNEYSSTTAVESTISSFNLLTLKIKKIPTRCSFFWWLFSGFCQKHCHASLWRSIFVVSVGSIKTSNCSHRFCEWPELKFHWLPACVQNLTISNCWRSRLWSTSGKCVSCHHLVCPRRFLYFVVFRSSGISCDSSTVCCCPTSMHGPN